MKHIQQPNRFTCLPTSFAMACGVKLEQILEIIGHDGSEIVRPGMEHPYDVRAFHPQECIWAAWELGFAVTEFELAPRLCVALDDENIIDVERKFDLEKLTKLSGVLTGETPRRRHAVAFKNDVVYDPNGRVYDFRNQSHDFDLSVESIYIIHRRYFGPFIV